MAVSASTSRDALLLALPKVQLHCHLEGTIRPATFLELAGLYGIDLSHRGYTSAEDIFRFTTFHDFLLLFRDVCRVLRSPGDFARLASDYVDDALACGVAHAELFISPSAWTFFHPDLDVREVLAAMNDAIAAKTQGRDLSVAFICDVTRNFGPERALETAKLAVTLSDLDVVGIGLGGDEVNFPPALFGDVFAYARANGLHAVAHAGEAAGAHSVRDAIEILEAERIGHGVRAAEDPRVLDLLIEREIAVEMCPTSNRLTGAVDAMLEHPLRAFLEAGARVVLDADDPTLFGTTLVDEYRLAYADVGREGVLRLVENAIDASFTGPERKQSLRVRLAAVART